MTLIVDVRTDYKSPDYKTLCAAGVEKAAAKSYDELTQAHIKDYNTLYNRCLLYTSEVATHLCPMFSVAINFSGGWTGKNVGWFGLYQ